MDTTVVEACDGEEALHMIEQTQPDILLLDIGMPVLDGFAVVRALRENPRLATTARVGRYCVCHAGRPGKNTEFRL